MPDIAYVVELAKSYDSVKITRDALRNQIRKVPLSAVQLGVTAFAKEFGDLAAGCFVLAADLPLVVDDEGLWLINEGDERARDFPPGLWPSK